jgi:hypothetical protein
MPEGTFMWYLRPVEDLEEVPEVKYGVTTDDEPLVTTSDGDLILFEDPMRAEGFATRMGDDAEVVEVPR